MRISNIRLFIYFMLYVTLEILTGTSLVAYHYAFGFIYLGFLILLPLEISVVWGLLISFVTGLLVDVYYSSLGMHAGASVLMFYFRTQWLSVITPRGGYDQNALPNAKMMGSKWFFYYAFPLLLVHHSYLFFVEAGSLALFSQSLLKVVFSAIFTYILILIFQYLFHSSYRESRL
ncbi:MAG: Rod shape-determining protein MreD [Cyclobacteriaceae bacterium]|nr:Rod shape-determining protein MreD [Cyclobacteriaceae bacterium]MCH8514990.1 Rod shape-determining protein MreD [Cyclobacteriaceae bacterium]